MLQLDDVGVRFGDTVAVADVTLSVPEGEVLAVLGPSGCGKSTLLRAIAGLEVLATGIVALDGADLADVPTHRRGFALMFQDGQLFRHLDVAGNVAYPLGLRGVPAGDRAARVQELLGTVGLAGYGGREVATLSGGEQQRVALARALAAQPRLLLLDEPLSALDRSLRERLAGDLRGILTETGTTALLVTHDHDEAFTLADRMALMFDGRIVQHGPTQEVWTSPATREVAEFIGFGTFLEGEPAHRVLTATAQPATQPSGRAERAEASPDSTVVPGDTSREGAGPERAGASPVATGDTPPEDARRLLALRRSALRVDPEGSLQGTVVSAGAISDAVRVEVDLDEVGRVEALADQNATLRAGERVCVRADRAGMALLP